MAQTTIAENKENEKLWEQSRLELQLELNLRGQTVITHQYQTHPMRISRPFRLDRDENIGDSMLKNRRAYLYLRNNSPGLFAADKLEISLNLADRSQVYLTEQSATKVHPMKEGERARVNYRWRIARQGMVEFVPEPLILYRDSAFEQTTEIEIHPEASLFWSDIILPGRLARGERYQFRYYDHRLSVCSDRGESWFKERMYLEGQNNPFRDNSLLAKYAVWGNAIAIMPRLKLDLLKNAVDSLEKQNISTLQAATSVLPYNRGILIRVLADKTLQIKSYWNSVLNVLRKLDRQPSLPQVPK